MTFYSNPRPLGAWAKPTTTLIAIAAEAGLTWEEAKEMTFAKFAMRLQEHRVGQTKPDGAR
jgi:hypothetical protein